MLISIIEKAIREFVVSVELPQISTEYEVQMAIRQVMRDNPDIFWFSHQWRYVQNIIEGCHNIINKWVENPPTHIE